MEDKILLMTGDKQIIEVGDTLYYTQPWYGCINSIKVETLESRFNPETGKLELMYREAGLDPFTLFKHRQSAYMKLHTEIMAELDRLKDKINTMVHSIIEEV